MGTHIRIAALRAAFALAGLLLWPAAGAALQPGGSGRGVNHKWNIGIGGGYMHFGGSDCTRGCMGITLTVKGWYADLMGWGPSTDPEDWGRTRSSDTAFAIHGGYQIPLCSAVRVIPVVGYATAGTSYRDGDRWDYGPDGWDNPTDNYTDARGFDYGGVLCVSLGRCNLYAAATAHIYYGAVAIEF